MVTVQSEQLDLHKIAQSGQCFRMWEGDNGAFTLVAGGWVLHLRQTEPNRAELDCGKAELNRLWRPYFDLEADYDRYSADIPKRDRFLRCAAEYGRGVRILRQEPWETLITFILSQRKNIPAIRRGVECLSRKFGTPIGQTGLFAFPNPQQLAQVTEQELRDCAMGYRAPYLAQTARMVAEGKADLQAMEQLTDAELQEALQQLPGVGPKVASCVMLFAYHRIGAFPRDVWINRVIEQQYGGKFPVERYRGYAGVIQQYLFYYGRTGGKEK